MLILKLAGATASLPNSTSSTATATVDAEARLIGKDAVAPANFNISIGSPHTCANDAEVQAVLAGRRGGDIPLILDVRQADGRDANDRGVYTACHGALSIPWQKDQLVIKSPLLTDSAIAERVARGEKIIIFCRSGKRACKAADFLLSRQAQHGSKESKHEKNIATCFICCGLHQLAAALPPSALHSHDAYFCGESGQPVFKQLFDGPDDGPFGSRTGQSSTYTYILGCPTTKEAVIIDPVVERIDRDVGELKAMGLTPVLALNTHCHADHVTGTGQLKKLFPGLKTMISAASGARADGHLEPGGTVEWGHGRRLQVLATPGHTSGCVSFYCADMGAVFTGDALLIGGCGRTDFQEGSSETLYDSVHQQLFTLPPKTLVYPAHDYKGRRCSTIVEVMAGLGLPYPKKLDVSLPANLLCGIQD